MQAVFTQIRADLRRRRTQAAIVLIVSTLAAAVSTMAVTLLVRSNQPWDDAFARLNGAHLVFHLDAAAVSSGQLESTRGLPGVIAAGPPRRVAAIPFASGDARDTLTVIEQPAVSTPIGATVLTAGRWPQRPGEIALARIDAENSALHPHLGDVLRPVSATDQLPFTVVGMVADLGAWDNTGGLPRAWILPGQLDGLLAGTQIHLEYEMPYRFRQADSTADLASDRRLIESALPSGAESRPPTTWIDMRSGANWLVAAVSAVIFAFSVFALLAVTLIVASVVAGAVLSNYREIGIAKALGFTPLQVVLIVIGAMAAPGLLGALIGVPVGALLSQPFLASTSAGLNLPVPDAFDLEIDTAIAVAVVLLVVIAAALPALQAGRTNPARAIAMGSAPRASHRSLLSAGLAWAGVPRAASLGAGDAFARPLRALFTVAALGIGIATLTFAFTFTPTLQHFVDEPASWGAAQDVNVSRYPAATDAQVRAAIDTAPGTERSISGRQFQFAVPGRADAVPLIAMRGDGPGFGYRAQSGRWFGGPGEAVVASLTARDLHLKAGATVAGSVDGRPLLLRVVGVINDVSTGGRGFRTGWETLGASPDLEPDTYLVQLHPGSDPARYGRDLERLLPDAISAHPVPWKQWAQPFIGLMSFLVGGLTLVLVVIAAAGVFNATLLASRERMHDIATLRALGMTQAQTAVMVSAASLVLAVVAGALGIPVGLWLVGWVIGAMGELYGFVVFSSQIEVLSAVLVVVAGFLVALAGAAVPARWAATAPVAQVLRSE